MVTWSILTEDKSVLDKVKKLKYRVAAVNRMALALVCEDVISTSSSKYLAGQVLHRRSGRLANSLEYRLIGDWEAEVGSRLIYAAIHEYGGEIRPVRARFLRFQIGDKIIFTKGPVLIPARPYLKPALDETFNTGRATRIVERILKQEIGGDLK